MHQRGVQLRWFLVGKNRAATWPNSHYFQITFHRPPATKPKRQRSALRPDFRKTYGMRKNKTTGAIPGSGRKPKADPVCKTKAFYLTQSQVETGITGKEVREAISDFIQKKSEKKLT